jgi:glycosyltransferase involved in cell wall biosynthesis
MRIAILGTRGIPANYGGFETFAEELSTRLAARGHAVTVFCRSHYVNAGQASYRGVRLMVLPTVESKYLDTVFHSFISAIAAMRREYEVVLVCNAANSFVCGMLSLVRKPSVLNVDGIERLRKKWGWPGRCFYWLSELLAVRIATCLVSDAKVIQDYYQTRHQAASFCIPYGFSAPEKNDPDVLERLQLSANRYYLYVSRLEPENNAHVAIAAHAMSGSKIPLLVVGDAPYALKYKASLRQMAGPKVIFGGSIYGTAYHALQAHAMAYIQATEVGGTHPALVEAMGHGNLIFANDTPENREVLQDAGLYYARNDPASLAGLMVDAESELELKSRYGKRARARVESFYNWEDITDRYIGVFKEAMRRVGQQVAE